MGKVTRYEIVRGMILDRNNEWGFIWLVEPESMIHGLFSTLEKLQASKLQSLGSELLIKPAMLAEPTLIS